MAYYLIQCYVDSSTSGSAGAGLLVRSGLGKPRLLADLRTLYARPRARYSVDHNGFCLRSYCTRDMAGHLPSLRHGEV